MLPCLVSVLLTFEIQGVLKFEKKIRCQKVNESSYFWLTGTQKQNRAASVYSSAEVNFFFNYTNETLQIWEKMQLYEIHVPSLFYQSLRCL